jgi:hypothetical protein
MQELLSAFQNISEYATIPAIPSAQQEKDLFRRNHIGADM